MKKNKSIIIVVIILAIGLLTESLNAQSWLEITKSEYEENVEPTVAFFGSDSYSFEIVYKSYLGHHSDKVVDMMKGVAMKSGDRHYYNLPGQLSVQGRNSRILLDSTEKIMVLVDVDKAMDVSAEKLIYEMVFGRANHIQKQTINNEMTIRFLFSSGDIEAQYMYFGPDNMLRKIEVHYREEINHDDGSGKEIKSKPKMVYEFSSFQKGVDIPEKFKIESFIDLSNGDAKPTKRYGDFEFLDYRY